MKIGINGFSRLGRHVLRAALENDLDVVAINDHNIPIEQMVYLFQFDSTHGKFKGDVTIVGQHIVIDTKKILVLSEEEAAAIEWKAASVELVIECSDIYVTLRMAREHLSDTVTKVVAAAHSPDIPIYVMGLNHEKAKRGMGESHNKPMLENVINLFKMGKSETRVYSTGSATTNCVAPLLKVIHDEFEIAECTVSILHAVTSNQKILDEQSTSDTSWREGRSGMQNIIPATAATIEKAIEKLIPGLSGKISCRTFKVPVADVSVASVSVFLEKEATIEEINAKILASSKTTKMGGIIGFTKHPAVSTDFLGDKRSCIYDSKASVMVNNKFANLLVWLR